MLSPIRFGQQDPLANWQQAVSKVADERKKAEAAAKTKAEQEAFELLRAFLTTPFLKVRVGDQPFAFTGRTVLLMVSRMSAGERASGGNMFFNTPYGVSEAIARKLIHRYNLNEPGLTFESLFKHNRFNSPFSRSKGYEARKLQKMSQTAREELLLSALARTIKAAYREGLLEAKIAPYDQVRFDLTPLGRKALEQIDAPEDSKLGYIFEA